MTELSGKKTTITVKHPFTLTINPDERYRYEPGVHQDVPVEHAEHWYTQAHLVRPGEKLGQPQVQASGDVQELARQLKSSQEETERHRGESDRLKQQLIAMTGETDRLRASHEAGKTAADEAEGLRGQVSALQDEVKFHKDRADAAEAHARELESAGSQDSQGSAPGGKKPKAP